MPREFRTTVASRERNRVHAQKTRQRKKEQMQILQKRATELKDEQIRLKLVIREKSTATILVHLLAEGCSSDSVDQDDPAVEALLRRSLEDIPDPSKIPELPALILPGQHASKKMKANVQLPNDGIDYELLSRDRSTCTPEELDKIRRERNRMHAKRTRDRKRLFVEKLAEMCRSLEDENLLLHTHLQKLDPTHTFAPPVRTTLKKRSVSVDAPTNNSKKIKFSFDQKVKALLMAASQTTHFHEVSDNASDESI